MRHEYVRKQKFQDIFVFFLQSIFSWRPHLTIQVTSVCQRNLLLSDDVEEGMDAISVLLR